MTLTKAVEMMKAAEADALKRGYNFVLVGADGKKRELSRFMPGGYSALTVDPAHAENEVKLLKRS